jgi:hypothetical protein
VPLASASIHAHETQCSDTRTLRHTHAHTLTHPATPLPPRFSLLLAHAAQPSSWAAAPARAYSRSPRRAQSRRCPSAGSTASLTCRCPTASTPASPRCVRMLSACLRVGACIGCELTRACPHPPKRSAWSVGAHSVLGPWTDPCLPSPTHPRTHPLTHPPTHRVSPDLRAHAVQLNVAQPPPLAHIQHGLGRALRRRRLRRGAWGHAPVVPYYYGLNQDSLCPDTQGLR